MTPSKQRWDDTRVENIIGNLLRLGVSMAAFLVVTGGVLYLWRHGGARVSFQVFHGEPAEYRSVSGVLHGLHSLRGRSLIQAGLLVLIATPMARVAFSVWAFAREGDRVYVVITLIVLGVLLYSLV
ncbi:MAG TPA: DUF1634 domain-containing protein [Bryobacteraceae bacterium]|nr:DUF1634 domain-containing protein [Bryobacteraceae bacterium]